MSDRIEGTSAVVGDRYAITELIGRGGMADVHRGVDQVLGRPVAVKLLRDTAADESERARFTAEARTLARLSHPGLVTVLDAGTEGDQPFLVMELVEGPTLASCCAGRSLDRGTVASLGAQVAEALAYVHRSGVVHRDVKPGNVLLGEDDRVQLADFGIARLLGDTTHHTRTGMAIGSPAYLSPEQVSGEEVSTATDVYSLGLVLLEALTGRRAFHGTSMEVAFARLTTPPDIPRSLPQEWRELLVAMTALRAADRPSCDEVAHVLRRIAGDTSDAVATQQIRAVGATRVLPAAVGDTSFKTRLRRLTTPRRRAPVVLACALAAFLLLLVLAAIVDDESPGEGDQGIPDGVPARLEDPLRDLHEAIHGSAE